MANNTFRNAVRAFLMKRVTSKIPAGPALAKMGLAQAALELANNAPPIQQRTMPPYGTSKNSVMADRRASRKRKSVKRARRLKHA
jgi:hypothetical protein